MSTFGILPSQAVCLTAFLSDYVSCHMSAESFHQHFARLKSDVDEELANALAKCEWPAPLKEAVEYSLMAGGKRLRPALLLMATAVCDSDTKQAMPAACAIEMIHTYSLIHDDLPSMDDDDMRRGRPTSHIVFGEALAILAGDGLLTFAFETLGNASTSPVVTADCLKILASAAGGSGMVGGQILDLEADRGPFSRKTSQLTPENYSKERSDSEQAAVRPEDLDKQNSNPASGDGRFRVEQLIQIHRMKTGALITAALELGAAVARATPPQRQALVSYGQCAGLAFQIADDLLDVTGNNEKLGKETGRDSELGKLTYPSLIGVEASRQKADTLIEEACNALEIFGSKADPLQQLARFIVERDH